MKFFLPFVEPQHTEAVLKRLAKCNNAELPARRLRVLHFPGEDGKNRCATVGKALRGDGRVVVAILPLDRGGYSVVLADGDGVIRKAAPLTVRQTADYNAIKYFDPPTAIESSAGAGDDLRKRLAARRKLFGKVQATATTEGIAWGDALKKILLNPANLPLLAQAQEPKRPRAPRQRLSDAELERRIQQLESGGDIRKSTRAEPEAFAPVRRRDGSIDKVATEIKKIHRAGGVVRVRHWS